MAGLKRAREPEALLPSSALDMLVAAAEEMKAQEKIKEQQEQKQKQSNLGVRGLPQSQREAVFKTALDLMDRVLSETLTTCLTAVNGKESQPAMLDVLVRQSRSVKALSWVLVAELAGMCGVLRTAKDGATTLQHVCQLVREEIRCTGSTALVFHLLKHMAAELDLRLAEVRIDSVLGSVEASLGQTFRSLKRLLSKKRQLVQKDKQQQQQSSQSSDDEDEGALSDGTELAPSEARKVGARRFSDGSVGSVQRRVTFALDSPDRSQKRRRTSTTTTATQAAALVTTSN